MAAETREPRVLSIDAGGTMTDTFIVDREGDFVVGKAQTTPDDEAAQTARVSALSEDHATRVVSYRAVELVSLLAADFERAKRFVTAQLGPLAGTDDAMARLRETVLAFLTANGSNVRVARALHIHQNTVIYRVNRAEELLGRPVTERQAELTCALMLAARLGGAVLTPAS